MANNNDGNDRSMDDSTTQTVRRRFLAGVAATGGLIGAGGLVYAQQSETTSYRLDGITSGWVGLQPESIADATNPTLNLTAGTEYQVTWINSDGADHNFAILDSGGNVLLRTEIIGGQGATQTATFTASEDMAQYLCEVHPTTMVGDITFGETAGNATNQTTQMETTVDNSNVSDLPDESPGTGPLGESIRKYIAQLEAKEGVETDATGMAHFTLYPPDYTVQANVLFSVYIEGLDGVTAAHIHLDRPDENNPIVAPLYPTDDLVTSEINQTYISNATSDTNATNATNMTNATDMSNMTNMTNATTMTNATNGTGDQGAAGDIAATGDQDAAGANVPEDPEENRTHEIPADELPGTTLSDSQLVVEDLTGPFEDADSLLPLVEAMNNGEAFVQVHTEANPGGALVGTIMRPEGVARQGGVGNETTQQAGGNETDPSGNGKAKTGNGKAKNGNGNRN